MHEEIFEETQGAVKSWLLGPFPIYCLSQLVGRPVVLAEQACLGDVGLP